MNLLTPKELAKKLSVSVGAVRQYERNDPSFPKAIRVTARTMRWDEADINTWLDSKKEFKND